MPYGSILAKFKKVRLSTADGKHYDMEMNLINRLGAKIVGIPHLGFRHRVRLIFKMINNLSLHENARILDAGCGYGIYSFMLAEKKFNVDSLDILGERISAIKERIREHQPYSKRIRPQQGSLINIPYNDNYFDLIICSDVIEHMKEDFIAVNELARVLAPGGHLILTTPTNSKECQKTYKSFDHERPGYTDDDYQNFAKSNGLVIKKISHFEFKIGSSLFHLIQSIDNKVLLGLIFYPVYIISLIDIVLRIGEPNGVVCLLKKPSLSEI